MPKQFQPLGGKPLVQRVVERFLFDAVVTRVVVPVSEMLLAAVKAVAGRARDVRRRRRDAAAVGDARLEAAATSSISSPFTTPSGRFSRSRRFTPSLDAAREHGAAFPGDPAARHDSLRSRDDAIAATPDRSVLVAAQTPQCFRATSCATSSRAPRARRRRAPTKRASRAKYGHHVQRRSAAIR